MDSDNLQTICFTFLVASVLVLIGQGCVYEHQETMKRIEQKIGYCSTGDKK